MIRWGIGFFFLIMCFCGFYFETYKRSQLKLEFIPAIVLSSIGLIMFIGGILNMLILCERAILFVGCFLFVINISKVNIQTVFSPGISVFAVSTIILLVACKFIDFYVWDNYSHWALIVKNMLSTNRFPNFEDTMIIFQSYPTGSASFIYFICRIVGNTEGIMLFGQYWLTLSAMVTLYGAIKNYTFFNTFCITVTGFFLLFINMDSNGLMVDNLLSALGIASIVILFYYRQKLSMGILSTMPILCYLVEVKNSGIFFVISCWIAMIFFASINHKDTGYKKNKRLLSTLYITTPILFLLIWKKHVQLVFVSGLTSLHSMSLSNFESVFAGKTVEDIKLICSAFIRRMCSITQNQFFILLLLFITLLIFTAIYNSKAKRMLCRIGVFSLIFYLLYQISLLATYLFSMPVDEALRLASYNRYHITVIVYLMGIMVFAFTFLEGTIKKKEGFKRFTYKNSFSKIVLFTITLLFGFLFAIQLNTADVFQRNEKERRMELLEVIDQHKIPEKQSYIIYTNAEDNGYLYFLSRYEFLSEQVLLINSDTIKGFQDWTNYSYVLVPETNKIPLDIRSILEQQDGLFI